MWKSILLTLCVSLLIAGCDSDQPQTNSTSEYEAQSIALAPLGEACGSKIETLCGEGLYCDYSSGGRTGICAEKQVNPNIRCDNEKAPVCGLKDRQKLSYLNECEASRHGAVIVAEGFCENNDVVDSCDALVRSVGNCSDTFIGFEFQPDQEACAQVQVRGCEAELPFESLESCTAACVE